MYSLRTCDFGVFLFLKNKLRHISIKNMCQNNMSVHKRSITLHWFTNNDGNVQFAKYLGGDMMFEYGLQELNSVTHVFHNIRNVVLLWALSTLLTNFDYRIGLVIGLVQMFDCK